MQGKYPLASLSAHNKNRDNFLCLPLFICVLPCRSNYLRKVITAAQNFFYHYETTELTHELGRSLSLIT